MKIYMKAHLEAMTELMELMSIAGWLALVADLIWVIRDSIIAGYPLSLLPVFSILMIGFIIMTVALYKYHKSNHKRIVSEKVKHQLTLCKLKFKRAQ